MSLSTAMQIGRSALTASQLGLSVAGNNMSNAATPGYSRQVARFEPVRGDSTTLQAGKGVRVRDVRRQVDTALQARLWAGVSEESSAQAKLSIASAVETAIGELSDYDLSSQLSSFFASWSERANGTQSSSLVIQQGDKLASHIKNLRSDLISQRTQIDRQLQASALQADDVLSRIAVLNSAVARAEVDGSDAGSLRDQRDNLVSELSQYIDATAVEQPSGAVDILIGSTPVVNGGVSRGLSLIQRTEDGRTEVFVAVTQNQQRLEPSAGSIASLLASRGTAVGGTIDRLDAVASRLIFEINKIHSTGALPANPTQSTATLAIPTADRTRALNDPDNRTLSELPFEPVSGGFLVQVKQSATGATRTTFVPVDLDGRSSTGAVSTTDDTSADDLRAALNSVPGLSASFSPEGKLQITADAGYEFSFRDDTSGVLATLGVNAYFSGTDGADIAVRGDLKSNPSLLLAGRYEGGEFVSNGTALAIVGLQDRPLDALGGRTLRAHWTDTVQAVGVEAQAASNRADATRLVRESLESQRAAVSGVNIDEEAINLLAYQRQYQGAARLISVADELTQTLLSIL